jgi:predicted ThiF/HesA family dinucleotide-utilizing enzyme
MITVKLKGCGRKAFMVSLKVLPLHSSGALRISTKDLRIVILAEIRTEGLSNTTQMRYRLSELVA